jgi:ADP-heptose:LPS heptosyltransferase
LSCPCPRDPLDNPERLVIHMGGLGDMCLSESTFLSLSRHFEGNLVALGYKRFLTLFSPYFSRIERIESARWLSLFADTPSALSWQRIIFVGKDREGRLRERWQSFSREPLIFVEMYPGDILAAETGQDQFNVQPRPVEEFQLRQLERYGIVPVKKEIPLNLSSRVILYPESRLTKWKWPPEYFLELFDRLREKGVDARVMEPLGARLDVADKVSFEEPADVQAFLSKGGIFVSNDSGMAHLAGACGLYTITLFSDTDPAVWRPRGSGAVLRAGCDEISVTDLETAVFRALPA